MTDSPTDILIDILNVLFVEDSEDDVLLTLRELHRGGFNVFWERVETPTQLQAALSSRVWDAIISGYNLSQIEVPKVLEIVRKNHKDVPFIVVSRTVGEESAVELMRQGANDYLLKGHLTRLPEAMRWEIREAQVRADRRLKTIELAQTKERLKLAIEGSGIGLWDWNLQSGVMIINERWAEILGYTLEELEPINVETWWKHVHADDLQKATLILQQHLQRHTDTYECELRMQHKLGAWVWVLISGKVVEWDADGNPQRMIGTHLDISGRKQSVEMLLKLNETLEKRVQQRTALIHQQVERESLLREITQRIRQSLDLQTIFDTAVEEVRHYLKADRVGIFKFYPDSHFDDGEFVAESVEKGFPSALSIRVHDHTFGENYAALYAKGRAYIVDDIYNSGVRVCHVDILARFQVKANIVMPLLCGETLWGLLCIHQCASTRHWQQTEISFSQQIINQLAIAIQQVSLFEQLQQELSERQQTEAKLTESNYKLAISNEELIRATRLKDEFLANMSHELRTPLNAILGMTEGMIDGVFGVVSDRQIKALKTIESSGTHLLDLINDILDVAKIESGQVTLDLTNASIEHLCQSSMTLIKQQAANKRIKLIHKIPQNLPPVRLDERRIRQVLINLLNNAVKFTPEGGTITLRVSQEGGRQTAPKYIRIAVIDTGIGIAAENIPKLFQPFIQIDSSLNRQYVGTGLGLALVKRIVELHGGQVELTSELGVGSCFIVDLPYDKLSQNDSFPHEDNLGKDANIAVSPSKSPLILLAEDNEANISTFSSYLEAIGYRLLFAKNGQEAIALAKLHHPDLILMDIQMPIIDGLEATKQIRRDPDLVNIPIMALTALAMEGDREICLQAGADEYLSKPIKLKQLATMIQKILKADRTQS